MLLLLCLVKAVFTAVFAAFVLKVSEMLVPCQFAWAF